MAAKSREDVEQARKEAAERIGEMLGATRTLLEPLKDLTESQMAAVATLELLMRIATLAQRPALKLGDDMLSDFRAAVDEFCPPLRGIELPGDPCFDANMDYVMALVNCEKDGRTEEECWESDSYVGAASQCTMEKINESKRRIGDWFGGLRPPRPVPWPEHR